MGIETALEASACVYGEKYAPDKGVYAGLSEGLGCPCPPPPPPATSKNILKTRRRAVVPFQLISETHGESSGPKLPGAWPIRLCTG